MKFKSIQSLQELVGDTIETVDDSSCNVIVLTTKSGKTFMFEAENAGPPQGLLAIGKYKQAS